MNQRLKRIEALLKEAAVSAAKQANRESFADLFPFENRNMMFSIADQWYLRFRDTSEFDSWKSFTELSQVIDLIKQAPVPEATEQAEPASNLLLKYPNQKQHLQELDQSFLSWANSRWGDSASIQEIHPISDALPTLLKYQEKLQSLRQKAAENQEFADLLSERFQGKNIASIKEFSIDEMEKVMALSERKKVTSDILNAEFKPQEFLGKFGEWNLWMPHSREDSIYIAGFDKDTLEPKTEWCTARTSGSNLFYSYSGVGVILFYAIKSNPSSMNDYQSIGFIRGEAVYRGDGAETVNGANKGMTKDKHRALFGSAFDLMYQAMQEKTRSLGGKHPVAEKFDKAAMGDEAVYADLTRGVEPDGIEAIDEVISQKRINIVYDSNTPAEVLVTLSTDPKAGVRRGVAKNPSTPAEVLVTLSTDPNEYVKEGVAANPSTPAEMLVTLSTDPEVRVKRSVAENTSTPAEILLTLSTDLDAFVREGVAANPNTPAEALLFLSTDLDKDIRRGVATNPSTPAKILLTLSTDPNEYVRRGVARNLNTPAKILLTLSTDPNEYVRRGVATNPSTPAKILLTLSTDPNEYVKEGVAKNLSTPAEMLVTLSTDPEVRVKRSVAENTSTPAEILLTLSTDLDAFVREGVAANPNTPAKILLTLSTDPNEYVKEGVAANPSTPAEALLTLSTDPEVRVKRSVAENTSTPAEILLTLSTDLDAFVREGVAANPNTPAEALLTLSTDFDESVRNAAKNNPNFPKNENQVVASINNAVLRRVSVLNGWLFKAGYKVESFLVELAIKNNSEDLTDLFNGKK